MPLDLKKMTVSAHGLASTEKNVAHILSCNEFTEPRGLSLNATQALSLLETRSSALKSNGRFEFGDPIIDKIIYTFSDSTYLNSENYVSTLHDLIDIFYYFKNECKDLYSDDDLIDYLYTTYEGYCQGSITFLAHKGLERLLHPEIEEDDAQDDFLDTPLGANNDTACL